MSYVIIGGTNVGVGQMSYVIIGGTNFMVGKMSGGANVRRTNVGGTCVGGTKLAPPGGRGYLKCHKISHREREGWQKCHMTIFIGYW
jgi:hypothetical protein